MEIESRADPLLKIKKLEELKDIAERFRQEGKRIVHCHGVFDLMHPGHIRHLREAKKEGDVLIVTVTRDEHVNKGPGRPVFTLELRLETLASLEFVDIVAANNWPDAVETLRLIRPHVYAKGHEYRELEDVTGHIARESAVAEEVGARMHFVADTGIEDVRSTTLLNTHFNVFSEETREFLSSFKQRHKDSEIIERLEGLKNMRALVIGDTIIDEYNYCKPLGKSLKENMVAMRYLNTERFAGGVLACANHLANFVGQVRLVSCLGMQNSYTDFIVSKLKHNVEPKFFYRPDSPTTVKSRFIEHPYLSKIFEAYYFEDSPLETELENDMYAYLERVIPEYDFVMVTDYGHGFLSDRIINLIAEKSKYLAVNAQTNAGNFGYNLVTKYPRADYVCIDEPEIRLSMQDRTSPIETLIEKVSLKLRASKVIVTRGHVGSTAFGEDGHFYHTPVFSSRIVDRMGAGDAYLAVTTPCAAAGFPMDLLGFVGNAAGAFAIGIVGNRESIEAVPLFRFIKTLLK